MEDARIPPGTTESGHEPTSVSNTTNVTTNVQNNIVNVAEATERAGAAGRGAAGSVMSWISAYAGFGAVERIIDDHLHRLAEVAEAMEKLQGVRLGDDSKNVLGVMRNLHLEGMVGEQKARDLIAGVTAAAPVDRQGAAAALQVANAAGVDPRTAAGMEYARTLAAAFPRMQLDENTATMLVRSAKLAGVKDAEGLRTYMAELSSVFGDTLSTNMAAFLRGQVAGGGAQMARGADGVTMMAVFSTLAGRSRGEQAASRAEREIYDLAGSKTRSIHEYLSDYAARSGVTTVADADVDRLIAEGREPEAKKIAEIRRDRALLDERATVVGQGRAKTPKQVADRQLEIDTLNKRLDDSRRAEAEQRQKLVARERARLQGEAFDALSPQDKLERVLVPAYQQAQQTPAGRAAFDRAMGSNTAAPQALALFAGDLDQYRRALAAGRSATAADTVRAERKFGQTRYAKSTMAEAASEADEVASRPGQEFAADLVRRANVRALVKRADGDYVMTDATPIVDRLKSLFGNDDKQVASQAQALLAADIDKMYQQNSVRRGLSPGQQGILSQVGGLKSKMALDQNLGADALASTQSNEVGNLAVAFGELKHQFEMEEDIRQDAFEKPLPPGSPKPGTGQLIRPPAPRGKGGQPTAGDVNDYAKTLLGQMAADAWAMHQTDPQSEEAVYQLMDQVREAQRSAYANPSGAMGQLRLAAVTLSLTQPSAPSSARGPASTGGVPVAPPTPAAPAAAPTTRPGPRPLTAPATQPAARPSAAQLDANYRKASAEAFANRAAFNALNPADASPGANERFLDAYDRQKETDDAWDAARKASEEAGRPVSSSPTADGSVDPKEAGNTARVAVPATQLPAPATLPHAPAPATQPSASAGPAPDTAPLASAGDVHHHAGDVHHRQTYNTIHVGTINYGDDDDWDLPGGLDGFDL